VVSSNTFLHTQTKIAINQQVQQKSNPKRARVRLNNYSDLKQPAVRKNHLVPRHIISKETEWNASKHPITHRNYSTSFMIGSTAIWIVARLWITSAGLLRLA
jgi:hypothetical protein